MSRVIKTQDAFLGAQDNIGYMRGSVTPIAKLAINGPNALAPDFRSINALTPYIRQNVLCFLLEAPRFFEFLGNGEDMAVALKALVESRAEKIDGLDASLTPNYAETPVGRTEVMHTFTKTNRERSEPTFVFTNSYGRGVSGFYEMWVTMGLADATTGIPGIVTLLGNSHLTARGRGYSAYVHSPEMVAATMIFIEPDPTGSYPVKAFLCTNMMPNSTIDYTASRDIQGTPDKEEVTMKFTCMQEVGGGVMELASRILATINKTGTNSNERRPYLGDYYSHEDSETTLNVLAPNLRAENSRVKGAGSNVGEMHIGYVGQANDIATTEGIGDNGQAMSQAQGLHGSHHETGNLVRPDQGNSAAVQNYQG